MFLWWCLFFSLIVDFSLIVRSQDLDAEEEELLQELLGPQWGVFPQDLVLDQWTVKELKFFESRKCDDEDPLDLSVRASKAKSSVAAEDNTAKKAYDNNFDTAFVADCETGRGAGSGCRPDTVYVGAIFDFAKSYDELRQASNLTHYSAWEGINCIQLYQSEDYAASALTVNLKQYVLLPDSDIDIADWVTMQEFVGLRGGMWQQRPAIPHTVWKVAPSIDMAVPWEVREIKFYTDVTCSQFVDQALVISSSAVVITSITGTELAAPHKADDDDDQTTWQAWCQGESQSVKGGCAAEKGWLGYDFGLNIKDIMRCFRINQLAGAEVHSLTVKRWDGNEFVNPWDGNPWIVEEGFAFPNFHGIPDVMENTQPQANTVWQLEPVLDREEGIGGWEVYEWIIYTDAECKTEEVPAIPFASKWTPGHKPDYLMDKNPGTSWKGTCILDSAEPLWAPHFAQLSEDVVWVANYWFEMTPEEQEAEKDEWVAARQEEINQAQNCLPYDTWIAADLERHIMTIRCFKILQTSDSNRRGADLRLMSWSGDKFVSEQIFYGIGGGTWNQRPIESGRMWHFSNAEVVMKRWEVAEIEMSADVYCSRLEPPEEDKSKAIMSSDVFSVMYAKNAVDMEPITMWGSYCSYCDIDDAWIGMEFEKPIELKCVRIFQHSSVEKSASTLSLKKWSGVNWEEAILLTGIGGGYFHRRPASVATLWRLRLPTEDDGLVPTRRTDGSLFEIDRYLEGEFEDALFPSDYNDTQYNITEVVLDPLEGMYWEIKEVRFFTDAACLEPLPCASVIGPHGVYPLVSDYDMTLTKKTLDISSTIQLAEAICDNDPKTAVTLRARGWIGIDLRARPETIKCVEIMQQTGNSMNMLLLEVWDGNTWADPSYLQSPSLIQGLGVGVSRRPAPKNSIWRLSNGDAVDAWTVHEVEFFAHCSERVGCGSLSQPYEGIPVASGSYTEDQSDKSSERMFLFEEHLAFDKKLTTSWLAQCMKCKPREAWIGLQLEQPGMVKCIRIYQSGLSRFRSTTAYLEHWDGEMWVTKAQYNDLGGDSWHYRPRAPNTMWRILYGKRNFKLNWNDETQTCERVGCTEKTKDLKHLRSWGVSELQFFYDDDCSPDKRIIGRPIVSGALRGVGGHNTPENAVDGLTNPFGSAWAAACNVPSNSFGRWAQLPMTRIGVWSWNETEGIMMKLTANNSSDCDIAQREMVENDICANEWIGLDFHPEPKEVRCIKLMQSRNDHIQCCDPAEEVHLQRWDGERWASAYWLHQPKDSRLPEHTIYASFNYLGKCPAIGKEEDISEYEEERNRRDSDKCRVPLPGSVNLIGEPMCIKHPQCDRIFREEQLCCPMSDSNVNRCCCDYLQNESVFEDEVAADYEQVNLESAVIMWCNVFPWVFIGVAFIHWGLVNRMYPEFFASKFIDKMHLCSVHVIKGDKLFCLYMRWAILVRPDKGMFNLFYILRFLIHLCVMGFLGGAILSLISGWLIGEAVVQGMIFLSKVCLFSKSPYNLRLQRDSDIRMVMVGTSIRGPDDVRTFQDVLECLLKAVGEGLAIFGKFVIDFSLIFVVYLSQFPSLMAPRLGLDYIFNFEVLPKFLIPVAELLNLNLELVDTASSTLGLLFRFSVGIPRCQGPALLLCCVVMISMCSLLFRWIVYDFFGIYASARATVMATRPHCQKYLISGLLFMAQGLIFLVMQACMMLFGRSLSTLDPVTVEWMCPESDLMARVIGRVLINLFAFVGVGLFILAADGHFHGQDYIVQPMADKLHLDLSALDPDGTIDEGGESFRVDTWLALVPTTLGIWFDHWNVKAYLVKQRASVYTSEFRDPQQCPDCGEHHAPYRDIILATAKQVSLTWQVIPGIGVPIGKICEYFNNPPIFYNGTELPCFQASWKITTSPEDKQEVGYQPKDPKVRRLHWRGKKAMYVMDIIIPWLQRILCLGFCVLLIISPTFITVENATTMAKNIFNLALGMSFVAAFLNTVLPMCCLYIMGLVTTQIKKDEIAAEEKDVVAAPAVADTKGERSFGILIVQTVVGTVVGAFTAVLLSSSSQMQVLLVWANSLILPLFVTTSLVIISWCTFLIQSDGVRLLVKFTLTAILTTLMGVFAIYEGGMGATHVSLMLAIFSIFLMFLLMLGLVSEDQFPRSEMRYDVRFTTKDHFLAFLKAFIFSIRFVPQAIGIFLGLAMAMIFDQYFACRSNLDIIGLEEGKVQMEEEVAEIYTGPYCMHPNDWSPFSRIMLHWFTAPLFAAFASMMMDFLLDHTPVLIAILLGLFTKFTILCIFMLGSLPFKYYIFAVILSTLVSMMVGAYLERSKFLELIEHYETFEEEEVVMQSRKRPWEPGYVKEDDNMSPAMKFHKIMKAEDSIETAKKQKKLNIKNSKPEEGLGKAMSFSRSLRMLDEVRTRLKTADTMNKYKIAPELRLRDKDSDSDSASSSSSGSGSSASGGGREMAAIRDVDHNENELQIPYPGSPTHSDEVVRGSQPMDDETWVTQWKKQPEEWQAGIPPPPKKDGRANVYKPVT